MLRWSRGINRKLKESVLGLSPIKITIEALNPYVICEIQTKEHEFGYGISICSPQDTFDLYKGKSRAIGRAVKALKNKNSSEFIRTGIETEFPKSWTLRHILTIIHLSKYFKYKSFFTYSPFDIHLDFLLRLIKKGEVLS